MVALWSMAGLLATGSTPPVPSGLILCTTTVDQPAQRISSQTLARSVSSFKPAFTQTAQLKNSLLVAKSNTNFCPTTNAIIWNMWKANAQCVLLGTGKRTSGQEMLIYGGMTFIIVSVLKACVAGFYISWLFQTSCRWCRKRVLQYSHQIHSKPFSGPESLQHL